MKRFFRIGVLMAIFWVGFTTKILAQTTDNGYLINNFESQITLNQDSSLNIKETIETEFLTPKHGIFRIIPYIYSNNGKTINARIKILGVEDENGQKIPYKTDNYNQSKKLQIGDANFTVLGIKKYVIEYSIKDVVLDYGNGPEIYWNVTGSGWTTPINKASATVKSPFGKIIKTECFGCVEKVSENQADFWGKGGLTVVVQIDKNNNLKMPGVIEKTIKFVLDNWGYLVAIMPFIIMFIFWYKKGRDKRYLTENIYFKPEDETEKNVSLLNRPHLPLVYSPIDGLSPSEVGTIIDEKVDTKDIVAEIVELARLGYLIIKKIEKKKFLGLGNNDYELNKIEKNTENLNKFQSNLLKDLFDDKKIVKVSDLKNHFYTHLKDLKTDIYEDLVDKKMAENNFEKTQNKWLGRSLQLNLLAALIVYFGFLPMTANYYPTGLLLLGIIPTIILAANMPRKTAWGYSLHRQAVGLKYYLSKGKWREEIAEKNLFLEEMLPLAIALGVVNKLAADMKDLELEPPKYFQGMVAASFMSDFNHFSSSTANGLITSPSNYSGSGSWSGGSGFSGGGGGGFGGGGGGSW
jgi:uncharacterized membrane protein YgcG